MLDSLFKFCTLHNTFSELFQVPVEAERLTDNDLVLEQYLSPASPLLAGFRLDGFSAIRPRATHSPPSDVNLWDSSSTFLDNRQISPAVLYIQVSAFQVLESPILSHSYIIYLISWMADLLSGMLLERQKPINLIYYIWIHL